MEYRKKKQEVHDDVCKPSTLEIKSFPILKERISNASSASRQKDNLAEEKNHDAFFDNLRKTDRHEDDKELVTDKHIHEHHHHHHEHGGEGDEEGWHQWIRPVISFVMLAAGICLTYAGCEWFGGYVRLLWYLVAYLIVGVNVMKEAVESVSQGDVFNEFMLMSIASIGAFAIGEYPEAVAVMLFYCIGENLQDRAVASARKNIKSLVEFKPESARLINDDGLAVMTAVADVKVGDTIEVHPGERVPLDGVLLNGASSFDTAALTGESVPRTISEGDNVLAGMISTDSVVKLKVSRLASESAVSRILNMVEEATERKAPAELFIHKFARIYTPVVCGLALLVVAVPYLLSLAGICDYEFKKWFERALTFLVISCPCALVISIPLSYFAGIGAASKRGILFKGSNFIDSIARLSTVVFDKTGTLTTGKFRVAAIDGLDAGDLSAVASIEQSSSHPIAKALLEHCSSAGIGVDADVANMKDIAGYGLSGEIGGKRYLVGNARLLAKEGISYPDGLNNVEDTIVAVAKDGKYIGHILFSDTIKDDAAKAVEQLKEKGIGSVILSGDKQALVDKVAKSLGVDEGHGDLLPQDKANHVESLKEKAKGSGCYVAFVGDGINDAPVIALSDVGIAMGAMGSDMAIETADVVIQTDQPSRVAEAIDIARNTNKVVKENIIFAIACKVAIMILGVFGLANMWAAVFADVGVALICILNSLRAMRCDSV